MAAPKVKLFAITTVIFAVFGILFFGLSVTTIGKYKGQKTRVEHLEHKILAGKTEMLKVPEIIGKLRVADKAIVDLGVEVADLTEANEELTDEVQGLQKENTVLTIAKAVLETDKAGYTKNLVEARQAVEELRQQLGTNDGGFYIEEDLSIEETPEIDTHIGETSIEHTEHDPAPVHTSASTGGLSSTLNSIMSALQSSQFMFLRPEERHEELNSLITEALAQSESSPELSQALKDFAGKVSSSESTLGEIIASFDEAMAKL